MNTFKSEYDQVMLEKSKSFLDMINLAISRLSEKDLLGFTLSISLGDSQAGSYIIPFNLSWSDAKHLACCGGGGYRCVLFASPLGIYLNTCLYSHAILGMTTVEDLVSCLYARIVLCDFRSHEDST